MAIAVNRIGKGICRALAPVVLCSLVQAQTTAAPPAAPSSLAALHIAKLPDATTALASSTISASQPLHVLVGHSIFITTVSRLKRVCVSAALVVDSFTSSPRQIVVTAKTPGVSSVILWDQDGESATYSVSCDLNVANLEREIHQALPNENIHVEAQQDRIALSGTVWSNGSAEAAAKLAGLYAKNVGNSVVVR